MTAKIGSKKNVILVLINGCVVMSRKLRVGETNARKQDKPSMSSI